MWRRREARVCETVSRTGATTYCNTMSACRVMTMSKAYLIGHEVSEAVKNEDA